MFDNRKIRQPEQTEGNSHGRTPGDEFESTSNQPYGSDVHEMYLSFVCGELEVWDLETGEIFNPENFTDKNGEPKELSESTIRNILNNPASQLLIEKALRGRMEFYHGKCRTCTAMVVSSPCHK